MVVHPMVVDLVVQLVAVHPVVVDKTIQLMDVGRV